MSVLEPVLSIVIPTRNRPAYLLSLLHSLRASERQDFEIILQDNSDTNGLEAEIGNWNDPRVRYSYRRERLSIDVNCDEAVRRARGTYVCMLGDDDGLLLQESLEMLVQARASGLDAVVPAASFYAWPDLKHATWGSVGGRLDAASWSGQVRPRDAERELRRALRWCGTRGLGWMPRVYQGFVSRRSLEALVERAGSAFPGPSPDMANAIGLCAVVQRYVSIDYPFIVMGHSTGSGGGMGTARQHLGDIRAQAHLPTDTADRWDKRIPFYWSGPTIYAQSIVDALGRLKPSAKVRGPYMPSLYAACLVFEPVHRADVRLTMRRIGANAVALHARVGYEMLLLLGRRARFFVRNLPARLRRVPASRMLPTIVEAMSETERRAGGPWLGRVPAEPTK